MSPSLPPQTDELTKSLPTCTPKRRVAVTSSTQTGRPRRHLQRPEPANVRTPQASESTVDISIPFSARHFKYSTEYSTYIPCRRTAIGWPT
eukprot:9040166-Pyramimonas_sp.AAC.1